MEQKMSPYIPKHNRLEMECALQEVAAKIVTKGDLCYAIYSLGLRYIQDRTKRYTIISDACSAMSDAEHELRRRVLDIYEDTAIQKNGDIPI
jgi:hypothetical protein